MTEPVSTRDERGGGSGLTAKVGPLPTWGWIAIAAAGGIGVLLWLQHRRSAAQPTGTNNTVAVQGADAATVSNLQDELQTAFAQIRDLQSGQASTPAPSAPTTAPSPANPFPTPGQSPASYHNTGPLKQGTTLQDLAKLYWGDPALASVLYYTNTATIEEAAHKAGYASSNGGQILIPGINLEVPPKPNMTGGATS